MTTPARPTAQTRPHLHRDLRQLRQMALGFGIGSMLFGSGAALAMAGGSSRIANYLFAIGAVFFTSAAFVQLLTAVMHFPRGRRTWRRAVVDPDLVSAAIQLVGTLYFNIMTVRAVVLPPTADAYAQVWQPDVLGSACFLISSWIAWHPIVRARRHDLIAERSHVILWANMAGSVFFAISAWGAKLVAPDTLQNPLWSNMGTLLGAIGFLIASVLTWPRSEASYA